MPRPKKNRRIKFQPNVFYFKPQGVPLRELEEVELLPDELEAIKLYGVDGLDQKRSAEKMNISQPTFGRILGKAYRKLATAIIGGKAIKIRDLLTNA